MHGVHSVGSVDRARIEEALAAGLRDDPRVLFAYLHGSFLTDRGFRDVDVAVCLAGHSGDATAGCLALAQGLSSVTGLPVDVRALNGAPTAFVFHALRGRLLVCTDEALLADTIEETTRRYLDLAPLLTRATREAFGA